MGGLSRTAASAANVELGDSIAIRAVVESKSADRTGWLTSEGVFALYQPSCIRTCIRPPHRHGCASSRHVSALAIDDARQCEQTHFLPFESHRMFGSAPSKDKLQEQYNRLMEEAFQLSTVNRKKSDLKRAEAEEIGKQLDELEKKAGG